MEWRWVECLEGGAVRPETDPGGRGANRRESSRIRGPEVPGTVPAHRMARDAGSTGVGVKRFRRMLEDLHGVEPAPVLPVEAVWPAVGRGHDMCPRLGGEAIRLTDRLDAGAVKRQDQPGFRIPLLDFGWDERVILPPAVEVAAEGDLARLTWLQHAA